jgi:O-antigen/teichoic acid export membrane protein
MLKVYPEVLKKARQIFALKMKDFILYRSDEILVGAFVSITQVAFYGNYTMIINKLMLVVNILGDGMSAGVGNLIAEGNKQNIKKVFWEMTATRFFIMGIVIYPLLMFFQPVIVCWVGKQYLLPSIIAYLLIFNLFLRLQYVTVNMFVVASGLYDDVWTSWAELAINISVTLALAPY